MYIGISYLCVKTNGCIRFSPFFSCCESIPTVHSATLFLNILACLAYFTADAAKGVDFGLSILWFILFTPVSFVCWYRPVYKAFR